MESSDLIKDCQTYQERFELVKDEILCNRCQYEYHSEVLDKAMDNMNNAKYMTTLIHVMLLQMQSI